LGHRVQTHRYQPLYGCFLSPLGHKVSYEA
jgi:hypothetical protein